MLRLVFLLSWYLRTPNTFPRLITRIDTRVGFRGSLNAAPNPEAASRLTLNELFTPLPLPTFHRQHREIKPLHLQRSLAAASFDRLQLSRSRVSQILSNAKAVSDPSVGFGLNGQDIRLQRRDPKRRQYSLAWQPPGRPHVLPRDAQAMFQRGYGVVVNALHHRDARVGGALTGYVLTCRRLPTWRSICRRSSGQR